MTGRLVNSHALCMPTDPASACRHETSFDTAPRELRHELPRWAYVHVFRPLEAFLASGVQLNAEARVEARKCVEQLVSLLGDSPARNCETWWQALADN